MSQEKLLRAAFIAGAITDALAIVPMVVPPLARLTRGFDDSSDAYRFAMGYAASLMLSWTALLVWAYHRPVERRFVAALTILVICGLVLTEIVGVISGSLAWSWLLATRVLSAIRRRRARWLAGWRSVADPALRFARLPAFQRRAIFARSC